MNLHYNGNLSIEDLRGHPPEIIESLRRLLKVGVDGREDPRRQNFYEIEDGATVFYVHVGPGSAKVHLLATWAKDPSPVTQ